MNASNRVETVVVEGFVKHDPRPARRGVVVYLSPWWHGRAHFPDAPLRVRIPNSEGLGGSGLARGAPVRISCSHPEAPRRGASWWAAVAEAQLPSPAATPLADAEHEAPEVAGVPPIVLDPFFGRLVLEPRSNVFSGQRQLGGLRRPDRRAYQVLIERAVGAIDRNADHAAIERARTVVRTLELEIARIHRDVAGRARAIYVRRWQGARALPSAEKVVARITLSSARVGHDGRAELCFGDGDLFYGHWIQAQLDTNLCVQSAHVAGLQEVS